MFLDELARQLGLRSSDLVDRARINATVLETCN